MMGDMMKVSHLNDEELQAKLDSLEARGDAAFEKGGKNAAFYHIQDLVDIVHEEMDCREAGREG